MKQLQSRNWSDSLNRILEELDEQLRDQSQGDQLDYPSFENQTVYKLKNQLSNCLLHQLKRQLRKQLG